MTCTKGLTCVDCPKICNYYQNSNGTHMCSPQGSIPTGGWDLFVPAGSGEFCPAEPITNPTISTSAWMWVALIAIAVILGFGIYHARNIIKRIVYRAAIAVRYEEYGLTEETSFAAR